jgi:hypothetical protein
MKTTRHIIGVVAVMLLSVTSASFAQQASDGLQETNGFIYGSAGRKAIETLYTNSLPNIHLAVGQAWFGTVIEARKRAEITMIPLQPFDLLPPTRQTVTERLGKPERVAELQFPSEVKVPPDVFLMKSQFKLHCLWYGSLGICFLSPDKGDENIFAFAYDPKKDKP